MTEFFVVTGLIMSLGIGSIIISNCNEHHPIRNAIITILVSLVVGFTIASGICSEDKHYAEVWNDGKCPKCGVEWRFVNADYRENSGTFYYYVCDNCGKVIEQN